MTNRIFYRRKQVFEGDSLDKEIVNFTDKEIVNFTEGTV